MDYQSKQSEKYDFHFAHKIDDLQSFILAAPPCVAGTSALIRGSLNLIHTASAAFRSGNYSGIYYADRN
jgi:hypothetical protein